MPANSLIGYAVATLPFGVAGSVAAVSGVQLSITLGGTGVAGKAAGTSGSFGSVGGSFPVAGKAAAVSSAFAVITPLGNTPSQIGWIAATLLSPAPPGVAGSSQIGYATGNIFNPAPAGNPGASLVGYVTKTLTNPSSAGSPSNSLIGYAVRTLNSTPSSPIGYQPGIVGFRHNPIAVLLPNGTTRRIPIRTWDGTSLR